MGGSVLVATPDAVHLEGNTEVESDSNSNPEPMPHPSHSNEPNLGLDPSHSPEATLQARLTQEALEAKAS